MRKSKEEMNGFDFLKEIDDLEERERFRREFCMLEPDELGYRRPRGIVGNGYNSQLNKAILGHTEEQQLVNVLGEEEAAEVNRRKDAKKKQEGETRQFMSWDQARDVYNAASFLTQEHNLFFNAFITIAYKALKIDEEERMTKVFTSFLDEVGGQMKRWGYEWFYLYVHENSQERGLHTHVLAYVPPKFKKPFTDWCRNSPSSFFWRHCGVASKEAVDIQIKDIQPHSAARWQWEHIQYVTKGLDPDLIDRDPISGQMKTVFDLIDQRPVYRRPCGVIPFKRRAHGSRLIWDKAQRKAKREGMPMLSAFGDKAWNHLKLHSNLLGWEAKEHQVRTRRREQYEIIKGTIHPDEANDWIDQHRGHYSDADLGNMELQNQLLCQLRKKKVEVWLTEDVRQWHRDWMTWWDHERLLRQATKPKPSSMEELLKTLQV